MNVGKYDGSGVRRRVGRICLERYMDLTLRGKLSWILKPPFQEAALINARRKGLNYRLHPSSAAVWVEVDVYFIDVTSGIVSIRRHSLEFAEIMNEYVENNLRIESKVLYIGVFGEKKSPSFYMCANDLGWLGGLNVDISVEFFQNNLLKTDR